MIETATPSIIAHRIHPGDATPLEPAPPLRQWMEDSDQRHAYRCLPMVMANQYGWVIRNPVGCTIVWNGGPTREDLVIKYWDDRDDPRVSSHFGVGVVTFAIPYLFRTPEGVNLWVKGPSNEPKDGVFALEGIVETDWSAATFTMNWRVTRPDTPIHFAEGEPICMVVPIQRGLAESLKPAMVDLADNVELADQFKAWHESRRTFNRKLAERDTETVKQGWQKDYYRGHAHGGAAAPDHQTKAMLKPFGQIG